jgi:hypothetical protein
MSQSEITEGLIHINQLQESGEYRYMDHPGSYMLVIPKTTKPYKDKEHTIIHCNGRPFLTAGGRGLMFNGALINTTIKKYLGRRYALTSLPYSTLKFDIYVIPQSMFETVNEHVSRLSVNRDNGSATEGENEIDTAGEIEG